MSARLLGLPQVQAPGGFTVREAVGKRARRRGLAGLDALPAGQALWFDRCRSVNTLGMRIALDLVWLDRAGDVVRLDRGVRPGRVRACRRARSVVELGAEEGERFALRAGSPAIVRPVDRDLRNTAASFLTRASQS